MAVISCGMFLFCLKKERYNKNNMVNTGVILPIKAISLYPLNVYPISLKI
jgi:hypothetical protein